VPLCARAGTSSPSIHVSRGLRTNAASPRPDHRHRCDTWGHSDAGVRNLSSLMRGVNLHARALASQRLRWTVKLSLRALPAASVTVALIATVIFLPAARARLIALRAAAGSLSVTLPVLPAASDPAGALSVIVSAFVLPVLGILMRAAAVVRHASSRQPRV